MNKNKTLFYMITSLAFMITSCATSSKVANEVSLGMTSQEVIKHVGKPFSKNIFQDEKGNIIEEWSYKETTWDDGGWSWDKTVISTMVTIENNKVQSLNNVGERFKTKNPFHPGINIHKTIQFD